jgi:hypothetical protein
MIRTIKNFRFVKEDGTCVIWTGGLKHNVPPLKRCILLKAVKVLKNTFSEETSNKIRLFIEKHGVDWLLEIRNNQRRWETSICNILRNNGIEHTDMPTNDYYDYIQVITELAVGAKGGEVDFINSESGKEIYTYV